MITAAATDASKHPKLRHALIFGVDCKFAQATELNFLHFMVDENFPCFKQRLHDFGHLLHCWPGPLVAAKSFYAMVQQSCVSGGLLHSM